MGVLAIAHEALKAERHAPAVPARSRDELSFLPAVLEITETPPSPTARWLTGLIAAIFTTGLVWACVSQVDVVASAEGRVVPTGRSKVIQPAEAGIIRAIHVRDGQFVRQGEILVEFDTTKAEAERQRIQQELQLAVTSAARHRRLSETGDGTSLLPLFLEGIEPALLEAQTRLMQSQLDDHRARLSALDMERGQRISEQATVEAAIARLEAVIPLIAARSDARADLARSGVGSRLVSLEAQQLLVEARGDLAIQRHKLAELKAALQVLLARNASIQTEFHRNNLATLAEAERQSASLRQDLVKAEQNLRQTNLVAPIDGTVQQLAVHTISGVVQPSQQLMVIVPGEEALEVEALLPNSDIGFVQEGQPATIKFEAYNFTRYGTISGWVCNISSDSILDEKQGYVYAIRICMKNYTLRESGDVLRVTTGMSATSEITINNRSIISYLLSPIQRTLNESIREK
jgi:hemolysin D